MTRPPVVNRVVLEPMLQRPDDGNRIADRLSRFARERLPALLQEALRGFDEDAAERIVARLEIDLGDAPPDRIEQVLEDRLVKVLRGHLIDRFGFPSGAFERAGGGSQGMSWAAMAGAVYERGSTAQSMDRAGGVDGRNAHPAARAGGSRHAGPASDTRWLDNADLVTLAGWLEGRVALDARTVNQLFADALAVSAHDVAQLLREYGRSEQRRVRLVATLTAPVRARAVHALRPTDARQVIGDVDRFSERHRAAPVVAMTQQAFDAALWQTVFAYLLADRGGRFNRRMFLRSLLTRLAAHAGVELTELLDGLLARIGDGPYAVERDEPLREVLVTLRREAAPGGAAAREGVSGAGRRPGSRGDVAGGVRLEFASDNMGSVADSADDGTPDARTTPASAAENRDLEALDFYLEQGAWPWFAADATKPAALVLQLARQAPLRLVMVLRRSDTALGREARLMRLAASLDAQQRDQLVEAVEPDARRAVVSTLRALTVLIEHARLSAAQRRALLRGLNAATLERITAARAGAFDERTWLAQSLAQAAQAAGLDPRALGDALLLVTHGDLARKRRVRWIRARLVEAGVTGEAHRSEDARVAARGAQAAVSAVAVQPESASSADDDAPAERETNRFVRAFLLAWPTLVRVLHLPPRALQAFHVDALLGDVAATPRVSAAALALDALPASLTYAYVQDTLHRSLGRGTDPQTLLVVLNRLALLSGVPLRRWIAGLASTREWRQVDPGLVLLRSWRALSGVRLSSAETASALLSAEPISLPPQPATAAAAFLHFAMTGHAAPGALHWLSGSSDTWLDAVLRDDFAAVAAALRARSPDERMLQRLARHFRPASLARLITALEPKMSSLSLGLLDASRAWATTAARRGPTFAALERALLPALLSALLAPAAARTTERGYIDRVLDGLARRHNLKPEDLADELANATADRSPALHDLLKAKASSARAEHEVDIDVDTHTRHSERQQNRPQAQPARARERPAHAEAWRQFAMLMRYGAQSTEAEASIEAAITQLADSAPSLLARALRENATVEPMRSRLAALDAAAFARFAQAAAPRQAHAILALQSVVAGFATRHAKALMSRAQAAWLQHAARGSVRTMLAELVEESLHGNAHAARAVLARWRRAVRLANVAPALQREWLAWLAARETLLDLRDGAARRPASARSAGALSAATASSSEVEPQTSDDTSRVATTSASHASHAPLRNAGGSEAGNANAAGSADKTAPNHRPRLPSHGDRPQPANDDPQPIYVANAGMVLLWPFLQRYYELLDRMRNGAFVDFDARSRAIYLLHWLASGQTARHEAGLPLAKVMCGIAPSMPLSAAGQGELDAREQSVSEELLGGVRQNWDKLRNTTAEGLRESFLMRKGRLMHDESGGGHWTLMVEAKAYDMLLDTLPWRISMIQLSWMTERLVVQWRG
jgi:hypothetical protein